MNPQKLLPPTTMNNMLTALFIILSVFLTVPQGYAMPGLTAHRQGQPAVADTHDSLPGINPILDPASQIYPFRDAYPFVFSGTPQFPEAHALLSVAQTRLRQVRRGADPSSEYFAVDIRLYNDTGDLHHYYNLYWDPLIPLPGRLALYDSQHHYVCDLFESMEGSRKTIAARDWADIPASGYLGIGLIASLPYPTYITLPAGTYYLQIIYLPRVLRPFSETNTFDYSDHTELFRSNVVPITILEQPFVKPPKQVQTP